MQTVSIVAMVISAIPGVIALLGGAVGYGKTMQRLNAVEEDVIKIAQLNDSVTRIDERTLATNSKVTDIKESLDRIWDRLVERTDPVRSFRRPRDPD